MFDQSIYKVRGARQLIRVFGASKEGEQRPMKYMSSEGPVRLEDLYKKDPKLAAYVFESSLAQNVGDEPLIEVDNFARPR